MALVSASECTATVAMPISLQARWMRSAISPRLAMRILSNMVLSADHDQRFAELDRLGVDDQDLEDLSRLGRRDRVHGLHRLDQQQGLARAHRVADARERRRPGLGLEIDR